ncbi:DUF2971 domain-containing protein [Colwellia sp. D2M02]|uniref:DUF2971 domain-containing protein n=1 Tax=Colwellia sp. D2M02 TaxID=2841562 RepID=UPI001C08198C|nr:DUF2971 domain-containing protein [Colwellia sp. D2M02]MBU2892986.1 DUF2971 domain-containing protein [Colwellia sp. D2M02]
MDSRKSTKAVVGSSKLNVNLIKGYGMDSQIKNYFRNKKFASLEYLSNEKVWAEDSINLGLYFFLLDLKGKDTIEVFKKILQEKGSYASSYSYLGDIARKLFYYPNEREIATYYFNESLKYDDKNAHTLWNLFDLTKDSSYFLATIKINYEANLFELVSHNLLKVYAPHIIDTNFNKSDWRKLKEICLDDKVDHYHDLLMICCFHLEEFEYGIRVINEKEWVSKSILDLYLDKQCIDYEYAVKKSNYFERVKYLEGNYKRIYEEVKVEAKKGKVNPTKDAIIKSAFEAEEYNDVISLVEEIDEPRDINNQQRLYHIISSLYLGYEVNEEYEVVVNKQNFFRKSTCNPLYLAYLILRNIKASQAYFVDKQELHPIENWELFREAEEYLSHDSLLTHYMHDLLVERLKLLKDEWDLHLTNTEILKLNAAEDPLNEKDKTRLAYYLIEINKYEEARSLLIELEPSISVSNMLAVCFEKQGDANIALAHYTSALDLMKSTGELNDVIIANYLSCLNRSKQPITESLYNEYIDDFNTSIASYFRYDLFTAENGRSLYKYYPFNQFTLDALVNKYFYLASSEQLNDPIELPFSSLTAEREHSYLKPEFRLASFSNNENSMLMWSHYAENHTGLMVEYCFEGELPDGAGIDKVNYSNTTKRYKEKEHYLFNQYMLTKNKDWSYEKEVRLFAYKRDKIYYQKASYPNKNVNKASVYIKSITVGYKFPESTIKLIQSIITELNDNLTTIELRRAKLSEKNFFDLEYEVIN